MSFDPYEFDRGYASSMGDTLGQYTAKTFLWMMLGLLVTFGVAAIGYATDLGTVTPAIWQGLLGADLVLIESNYEPRLLDISSYYEVLFAADPASIGGAIPDDAFYYVP